MMKLVYGASIRGNGHYASGVECQDSNSFDETDFSESEIKVIALSDGHGGIPYFRSAIGSKYAVEISKKLMLEFIKSHKETLDSIDSLEVQENSNIENNPQKNVTNLEKLIKEQSKQILSFKKINDCYKAKKRKGNEFDEIYKTLTPEEKSDFDKLSYHDFKKDKYNPLIKEYNKNQEEYKKAKSECNNLNVNDEKTNINKETDNNKKIEELTKLVKNDLAKVKSQIITMWNEKVDEHFKNHSVNITQAEIFKVASVTDTPLRFTFQGYAETKPYKLKMFNKGLEQRMIDAVLKNPRQMYGATLLCIGSYKQHNFIIQIGDGDVTMVDCDNKVTYPIVKPKYQIANETDSICQLNAINKFSEIYFKKHIKMLMISTDGIANAFEKENELGNLAQGIYDSISEEPDSFKADFKPLLRRFSEGSLDDCTICFIADDIDNKTFEIIKESKEDNPSEDEKLLASYQPKFKRYHINEELYPVESVSQDKAIDVLSKCVFSKIGKDCALKSYVEYKDEICSILDATEKIDQATFPNKFFLKFKGDLISEKERIQTEFSNSINNHLKEAISNNPILVIKFNSEILSMNNNGQLVKDGKKTIYGMITDVKDDTISYVEITENNYERISQNIASIIRFIGKLTLDKNYVIEIGRSAVTLKKGEN